MTHAPEVELHRESVNPDSNGPILNKPLGNLRLVGWHLHPACHPDRHLVFVELASLIVTIITVVLLLLKSTDVKQGFVSIFHETSITAGVSGIAVHELLLRETDQFP